MKIGVCLLGITIIIGSILLYTTQIETVVKTIENPAYRNWVMEQVYSNSTMAPSTEAPPRYLRIEHINYPNGVLAGVIFLIGFVALVCGIAIPEEKE